MRVLCSAMLIFLRGCEVALVGTCSAKSAGLVGRRCSSVYGTGVPCGYVCKLSTCVRVRVRVCMCVFAAAGNDRSGACRIKQASNARYVTVFGEKPGAYCFLGNL